MIQGKFFDLKDNHSTIKCKLYAKFPRQIEQMVISCHGFGGSRNNTSSARIAEILLDHDPHMAVLTFDWPCHGDDVKKKLELTDCFAYLHSVIGYADRELHVPVDQLYLQATSFGGYVTLIYLVAYGNPFQKLALRCPAINMYDILTSHELSEEQLALLKKGRTVNTGFSHSIPIRQDFLDQLCDHNLFELNFHTYAQDILIVQGTKDEMVSYDIVKAFAEKNELEFVTIEGADHRFRDPAKMREYIDLMELFFELG